MAVKKVLIAAAFMWNLNLLLGNNATEHFRRVDDRTKGIELEVNCYSGNLYRYICHIFRGVRSSSKNNSLGATEQFCPDMVSDLWSKTVKVRGSGHLKMFTLYSKSRA